MVTTICHLEMGEEDVRDCDGDGGAVYLYLNGTVFSLVSW